MAKVKKTSSFNKYKKLKESMSGSVYKGMPVKKIAAFNVSYIVYFFSKMNFLEKTKLVVNFLFFVPCLGKVKIEKEALFGWSIARRDYARLSSAYKSELGWCFEDITLSFQLNGKKFRFDLNALKAATMIVKDIKDISFFNRLVLLLSIYKGLSFINLLEDDFSIGSLKRYLSFNSSFDYESVLTLFLRYKGVETFSMQHGMYFDYKNDVPFDVINYENVTAKYLLVWGQFTQDQVECYMPDETSCIVFGNPLYRKPLENCHDKECGRFLVGLPRKLYLREIDRFLCVLSKKELAGFDFVLKLHPDSDETVVNKKIESLTNITISKHDSLSDEFEKHKYAGFLGFNSSILFEATRYGLPVYQYVSGNDEFLNAGFHEFNDCEELITLIYSSPEREENKKVFSYFK